MPEPEVEDFEMTLFFPYGELAFSLRTAPRGQPEEHGWSSGLAITCLISSTAGVSRSRQSK